jgi:uncharacterized protein (DUF2147 family)
LSKALNCNPARQLKFATIGACLLVVVLAAIPSAQRAAEPLPVGLWTTIDNRTPSRRRWCASWRTTETTSEPSSGCSILRRSGDHYDGDEILDPDSGSVYRSTTRLEDGGRELVVRGYVAISLFGRSQTWICASQDP